jgi:hypothetical protein
LDQQLMPLNAISWSVVLFYAIAVSSSRYTNVARSLLIDCVIHVIKVAASFALVPGIAGLAPVRKIAPQ